jgi:DNA-binding NarL/FixJ family response regulator
MHIGEVIHPMILVIALPDLARRISETVLGARYVISVENESDLRHRVYSHQPDLILLDHRVGGSTWRAIDQVTAIVERTATHPFVIALLPKTSRTIEREAARLGIYDVLSVSSEDFDRELVEAVSEAAEDRLSRPLDRRRVSRQTLH